jgi:hypothetical protein
MLARADDSRDREQVSQFKLEQSDRLEELDLATKKIVDAIIKQQDIFQAAHGTKPTEPSIEKRVRHPAIKPGTARRSVRSC